MTKLQPLLWSNLLEYKCSFFFGLFSDTISTTTTESVLNKYEYGALVKQQCQLSHYLSPDFSNGYI